MGRWQLKLQTPLMPPLQNLQNSTQQDKLSSVGFGGTQVGNSQDNDLKKGQIEFASSRCIEQYNQYVTDGGLPVNHFNDQQCGDSNWIRLRLNMVASGKRIQLAAEYSQKYLSAFEAESNEVRRENVARRYANLWLLKVTSRSN